MRLAALLVILALVMVGPPAAAQQDETPAPRPGSLEEARRALERDFAAMLTGAELVGHFTIDGDGDDAGGDAPLREERYSITSITKIGKRRWRFDCRVRYGEKDVAVPIPLTVLWAGDTPVITLTDMKIPGLGTYTARVLMFRDQYAGTWSGGEHGGHLFGRIERPAD